MKRVSLFFSVLCSTELGEEVYICGNVQELGNWQEGVKLRTDVNSYPEWRSQYPIDIEEETEIEFKVCVRDAQGRIARWEQLPSNRAVAPTSNMQIIFEYSNPSMNFNLNYMTEVPSRKVTLDNVDELGESSSVSSGWDELKIKHEESHLQTNLLNEAKHLYQSWKAELIGQHNMRKLELARQQEIKHVFMCASPPGIGPGKFEYMRLPPQAKFADFEEHLSMAQLQAFHFSISHQSQDFLPSPIMCYGYIVLYAELSSLLSLEPRNWQAIAKSAQIIVANDYETLERIITELRSIGFTIKMQAESIFRVAREQVVFFLLLCGGASVLLSHSEAAQREDSRRLELTEKVEFLLLREKTVNFPLPHHYRVHRVLAMSEAEFRRIQLRVKLCLIVHCEKMSDLSVEVITLLEKLALRPNIEIYVLSDRQPTSQEIKTVMPLKTERMIIIGINGELYYPKSSYYLFKELAVKEELLGEFLHVVSNKVREVIPSQKFHIAYDESEISIAIEHGPIVGLFIDWLEKECLKLSSKMNLPMEFTKTAKQKDDGTLTQIVNVRSVLRGINFHCRMMASAFEHSNLRNEILLYSMDFAQNCVFNEKIEKVCNEKNLELQSFSVGEGVTAQGCQRISERTAIKLLQKIIKMSEWGLSKGQAEAKK